LTCDAVRVIEELRKREKKTFFFTNNSSKSRSGINEKLVRLGIGVEEKDVYTSGYAAGKYCSGRYETTFVIGTESLRNELISQNVRIIQDPINAQALVVGLDTNFTYEKMTQGMDALNKGCAFIVCNRDNHFPGEGGTLKPGSGPIVAALAAAGGREPDFVVGKPSTYMLDLLMQDHMITASEILIVGDSYSSDIAMAQKSGSPSAFLSRDTTADCSRTHRINCLLDLLWPFHG
jgi:HAD superfamily hydrolase (TIGR01450 family)